jgi:hypothetical protein
VEGSAFDYETIMHSGGERKVCLLVDAVDSAGASASFSGYCVHVTDVNEPPLLSTTIFNVAEGDRTDRLKLGTIEAVDKDAADAGGVTYTIKPDKWVSSTAGSCPFELVASKCPEAAASSTALTCRDVYLKSPGLDYEALLSQYGVGIFDHSASRMTVEVNLADSDPARIASPAVALLLIDVLNVNEAPSISASSISIPESVAVGSALGAPIAVTDPDEVQRDLVFRIITDPSKTGQITGDMVSIEASGGKQAVLKLKTPGSFDFENLVEYELVIEAEDGGNAVRSQPSQKSQTTLKVTITNVNDVTVTSVVYKTAAAPPTVAGHPAGGGTLWSSPAPILAPPPPSRTGKRPRASLHPWRPSSSRTAQGRWTQRARLRTQTLRHRTASSRRPWGSATHRSSVRPRVSGSRSRRASCGGSSRWAATPR